jgi:hydroxyethylthiazole kinase
MITAESIFSDLTKIREQSPLVHNITNFVVMNNTANALLSLGASPVMAHAVEEVRDMVKIAASLVLNMGTLNPQWVEGMIEAGKAARQKGIPIVFDPVGVGATPYRNETANRILTECHPDIIRGNASEIMALVNTSSTTKGVDSTQTSTSALESARVLSKKSGAIVIISGAEDFITNGKEVTVIRNGVSMMSRVTGMGCTATAITAAFAAVNNDFLKASAHAMAIMGIAGETAAQKASGPGSLQMYFLDTLFNLSNETIKKVFLP